MTIAWTDTVETADPSFTARYTRNVTTQFDNTVNDTTWRLGEARRVVDTTTANAPYLTGATSSDTRTTALTYDSKGRLWRSSASPTPARRRHKEPMVIWPGPSTPGTTRAR